MNQRATPVDRGRKSQPDYGVDGRVFVVGLLAGGGGSIALGALLELGVEGTIFRIAGALLIALGAIGLVPGILGWLYVTRGKFRHRDRVLDRVRWRGDEQTLDIGTGGGLLLVGAAKRTPKGRAFGVDVWDPKDLSNNTYDRAMTNVTVEGVADRVEIRSDDARKLSFADETFDVIVSMLCIHNIEDEAGRQTALGEAVRVCKPGGVILVSDLANTASYVEVLRGLGMTVSRSGAFPETFPPQRIVEARKPS